MANDESAVLENELPLRGPNPVADRPPTRGLTVTSWGQVRVAAVTVMAVAAVVALTAAAAAFLEVPFGFLSKEPAESLNAPRYVGYFAYLVVLVWAVGATSGVLTGAVMARSGPRWLSWFYLAAGLFTGMLLLDDFFMVHENLYRIGLPEEVLYAFYGLFAVVFLWRFRSAIAERDGILLVALAGAFLALSGAVDFVGTGTRHALEDGAKAAGASIWVVFIVRSAYADLTRFHRSREPSAERP